MPSGDVRGDLARIDSYKSDAEKQDERIPLMRQLAVVGGSDVAVKFVSLLNDEFLHVREEAKDSLAGLKGESVNEILIKQGLGVPRRTTFAAAAPWCLALASARSPWRRCLASCAASATPKCAWPALGTGKDRERKGSARSQRRHERARPSRRLRRRAGRLGRQEAGAKIERLLSDKDGLCVARPMAWRPGS